MSSSAPTTSNNKVYPWLALAAGTVLALAIGHDLVHMPLQVNDCLSEILDAARADSAWSVFYAHLNDPGFFRPLYYAESRIVFDFANGHYAVAYRLFQAALVFAFVILFARALQVRDRFSLAAVPLALTVFIGIHTFLGTVKELYPITHFLQVAVLALLALNLTQSRSSPPIDVALLVTFILAALTLESGVLVWVIIVAAWISGMPGASRRAVAGATILLAGYFVVRFGFYGTGVPVVGDRSQGFLFGALDPPEIRDRFGDNPLPLYAYNVFSSISSILFSEPRSGLWVSLRALVRNNVAPRDVINVGASLFATGLIVAYVVERLRSGIRRPATLADRHVVIFAAVLGANAALSFSYAKDEVISIAGAFYAFPVFGAAAYFLRRLHEHPVSRRAAIAFGIVFLVGSAAWATRAAGVHHVLQSQAFVQRNDWTRMEREWRRNGNWEQYASSLPLIEHLRSEAIQTRVVNPRFVPRWMERVFDIYY